ncbi:MAG: cobalamin biosynthesis protein CobQ [Clostridia bacterium]|nr:cobalamin biosynthesis protein CobQ [Clostridia bacterium]
MKKYIVVIGNFGSGKTELSLNLAFEAAEKGSKVTLVDLDIINPYFRSTERSSELEAAGIKLFSPTYAMLGVEIPSLPAEIYSVFSNDSDVVIFDVGGDAAGAIALGQYKRFFKDVDNIEVLYVINARRPFSCELELNLDMIGKVTEAGRIAISAIVNNTNLSQETALIELIDGYDMVKRVSEATGLPVKYTIGCEPIISEFREYAESEGLDPAYIGTIRPISRYMHRDWERYTEMGL